MRELQYWGYEGGYIGVILGVYWANIGKIEQKLEPTICKQATWCMAFPSEAAALTREAKSAKRHSYRTTACSIGSGDIASPMQYCPDVGGS